MENGAAEKNRDPTALGSHFCHWAYSDISNDRERHLLMSYTQSRCQRNDTWTAMGVGVVRLNQLKKLENTFQTGYTYFYSDKYEEQLAV